MKKILFVISLITMFFIVSCEKENLTDSTDITLKSWRLKRIIEGSEKSNVDKGGYFNEEAYNLHFENDSVFQLNTSVNLAKGIYNIPKNGVIEIISYHEFTEVGSQNKIDKKLLEKMITVDSYQVLGEKLFFTGKDCEFEFYEK